MATVFGVSSTTVIEPGGLCASPHDPESGELTAWAIVKEDQKSQTYRCNFMGGCGRVERDNFSRFEEA